MKRNVYKDTWVIIDKEGYTIKGGCACAGGIKGRCKHVFAVLWQMLDCVRQEKTFIEEEEPCTSKPRTWGTGSNFKKVIKPLQEMNFLKHDPLKKEKKYLKDITTRRNITSNHAAISLTKTDIENQAKYFSKCGLEMLVDILADNDFTPQNIISLNMVEQDTAGEVSYVPTSAKWDKEFEQIINANCIKNVGTLLNNCNLSLNEAWLLEIQTRDQGNCTVWSKERSKRLTSSKFGFVIKQKAKVSEAFINTIWPKNSIKTAIMKLGSENEKEALKKYLNLMPGNMGYRCGLVVNPGIPFLAASPDQLIYNEISKSYYLLEIKTLVKGGLLQKLSIPECIEKNLSPFLEYTNGVISLKKNHVYYMQIQGQLAMTGLDYCDLFVDAGEDVFLQRIQFNEKEWTDIYLPSLTIFYFNYFATSSS